MTRQYRRLHLMPWQHARWRSGEVAFWVLALSCAFLFPSRYLIMTDILRLALFALSLDLILGYAGIVSLGHAAFFGVGAYSAGLLALHGIINEPVHRAGRRRPRRRWCSASSPVSSSSAAST